MIVEKLELSRQHLHESNLELSNTLTLLEQEISAKNKAQIALQQKQISYVLLSMPLLI